MANKKEEQKDKKVEHDVKAHSASGYSESLFPACFLACVLTAVIVSIAFALSFSVIFHYELRHKYGTLFAGQFEAAIVDRPESEILELESGELIDFFESGQTGFIFASSDECTRCYSFSERLYDIASAKDALSEVYRYNYPANNEPSVFDDYAEQITLDGEQAPVLLYVRDGRIYDRLDETNGKLGLDLFISKYK